MEQDKPAQKVSFKRIAKFFLWLFAGVVGLVVLLVIVLLVADTVRWQSFRRGFLEDPSLRVFPVPLTETSLATPHGITTVTQSGCSIDLPWSGVTVTVKMRGVIVFPDGRSIIFDDPAKESDAADMFRGTEGVPSAVPICGAAALRSNYDLLTAQLNFNPTQLTRMPYGRKRIEQVYYAVRKSMAGPPSQPGPHKIYSVTLSNVRGFQFGDVSQNDLLELRMFDPEDHQFHLFASRRGSNQTWTQPEINFIVHSMRCDAAVYNSARQAWQTELHQHR